MPAQPSLASHFGCTIPTYSRLRLRMDLDKRLGKLDETLLVDAGHGFDTSKATP